MQITLKRKVRLDMTVTKAMKRAASIALIMLNLPLLAAAETPSPHPLAFMFGEWVGPASGYTQDGQFSITQTERVGPILDGNVVMIEGRGYTDANETAFNALAVISKTAPDGSWEIRSYAQGRAGTFPIEVTETGYTWSVPAGPGAQMIYTAAFDGGTWSQTGTYTPEEGMPRQTFQMMLTRVGETDWPMGDPVSPDLD